MRIIKKIDKKPGATYTINEDGIVVEMTTSIKFITKINKQKNMDYSIMADGSIVEKPVIFLSPQDFFKYKENGKMAELFRQGYEVKIKEDTVSLSKLQEIEDNYLINSFKGSKLINIQVNRDLDKGERHIHLFFDNKKSIILKQGLLVSGSVIEIKEIDKEEEK